MSSSVAGRTVLKGLEGEVAVLRDRWGIPHVKARSAWDAFFGQGYVHAQDRLWQMDAARRRAVGRWAEWIGPSAVSQDVLARQLDCEGASRRDAAALSAEGRSMLEAYAAGVNAYIAGCADGASGLPVEYGLLGATPEAWEPWQSVAAMRQRGWLMGSVWFKLWRAAAIRAIGPNQVAKLRYDDGSGGDLLCVPPGAEGQRWIASLRELAPAIEAVAALGAVDSTGGGSNNWALSGARTASGRPMLAGDPHRQFEIPSMYAQGHIACEAFDAIGFSVPGVPAFPHFGHNGTVAWCVTHAFADIHDLYVERFPGGDASHVEFRGERVPVKTRSERIAVHAAPTVEIEVIETHHGPIIAGDPRKGAALALRSIQVCETDRSLDCLQPMLQAKSVNAFYDSTRGWGLIDHNLVAADTHGSIGHLVRALLPDRPRINGWLPVPGWTGEHEWRGMVPFERMPRVVDPPEGVIVTANNRVVGDDNPDYFGTDFHPPYRARRILERLNALQKATVEDMTAIHADTLSVNAILFRDRMASMPPPRDSRAAAMRELILGWDGRMSGESAAPTAYIALRREVTALVVDRSGLAATAKDPLGRIPPGFVAQNQMWWAIPNLLRANDASLLGGWTWNQIIAEALARVGPKQDKRQWREAHKPAFAHPLTPVLLNPAGLDPKALPQQGDGDCVLANGLLCSVGMAASYGAIARYVMDVGAWDNCHWVVFHGASGRPGDPHYEDQHAAWTACELVPMLYDWSAIEAGAESAATLAPA